MSVTSALTDPPTPLTADGEFESNEDRRAYLEVEREVGWERLLVLSSNVVAIVLVVVLARGQTRFLALRAVCGLWGLFLLGRAAQVYSKRDKYETFLEHHTRSNARTWRRGDDRSSDAWRLVRARAVAGVLLLLFGYYVVPLLG